MGLIYTLLIGIPLCIVLITVGVILCATVIGIPVGVTLIAVGFKYLTLPQRRFL
jgi:uncharacterized membrane protein YccF (DUF307 family)